MYGKSYGELTAEEKKILHADSVRRAKLIEEREQAVLKNNLKAFEDEAKMEKVLALIYKDCQKQILADVTETISKVQKAGGTWSYANQSALTRSRGLFEQITDELNNLGQKEQIAFTQGLSNIYTDQFLRQVYELGQSITVKANFNRLNPELVKKTLNYPWSGAMFSDRLWNDKQTLGRNLRIGLTQSMVLGESIPQITDRISRGLETSRYNAERIARTETKRVTYVAHNDAYEDMGVNELKYRCANGGDSRTCAVCFDDNGKTYKRGEEPTLPRHPNCRCVYIPVVSDTFADNELNELTHSVRGAENYEKWIEANKDKINPDGSLKDGWVRDWKNGGKLVNKNAPVEVTPVDFSNMNNTDIKKWEDSYYKVNTPNLTKSEITALDDYGEGGYEAINGVTRYAEGSPEYEKVLKSYGEEFINNAKKEAEDLSRAISKFDLNDTIIVQRAERDVSHITGSDNSIEALQGMIGKTYTEKGFTSTSLKYQSKFEGGKSDAVHIEITVPKGSNGAYIDKYVSKNEREFLLNKNTNFYVTDAGERVVQVQKYDVKTKQFVTVDKKEKYMKVQVLSEESSIDISPVGKSILKTAKDNISISVDPVTKKSVDKVYEEAYNKYAKDIDKVRATGAVNRVTNQYLNDIGSNITRVDLKGLDVNTAKTVSKAIVDLDSKWISTLQEIDVVDSLRSNVAGSCTPYIDKWERTGNDKDLYSRIKYSLKEISPTNALKYWEEDQKNFPYNHNSLVDKENYLLQTIYHEYGHSILGGKVSEVCGTNAEAYKEIKNVQSKYRKAVNKQRKIMRDARMSYVGRDDYQSALENDKAYKKASEELSKIYVSKYANESTGEFIAECFANACLCSNPSSYSVEVFKVLKKYFGK